MAKRDPKINLLSVRTVESAKHSDGKGEWRNDGDGLRLRVRSSGNVWYFAYKPNRDAREVHIKIGDYPTFSLKDARERAKEYRQWRADGKDPAQELEAARFAEEAARQAEAIEAKQEAEAPVMNDLFKLWDQSHGAGMEPHWRAVRQSHWRCHIAPVLGDCKIKDADKGPMKMHYDKMVKDGIEVTARRVLAFLKQVVNWGVERQLVADDHPLTRLVIPRKKRTVPVDQLPENFNIQDFLSARGEESIGADNEDDLSGRALSFSELATLLHDLLPKATQAETGKCIVRLMLATGIRTAEAVRLRWDWIDLDRRLLIIPAGGMKKRRMHHVHLSEYAAIQLQTMQATRLNDFVFPAPKKENDHVRRDNVGTDISNRQFYRLQNETDAAFQARLAVRMKNRRCRADYDLYNLHGGKWTLYDMRRTAATRLEELGFDREMVGRVLAHARPDSKTTGRYAQYTHWQSRCNALDALGKALETCESGAIPAIAEATNVVMLSKRA